MKRLCVEIGVALVLCLAAGGDSEAQSTLRLGLTAGLAIENQSFSPDLYSSENPQTYRTGFAFGGLAEIGFTDVWSLFLEPKYIQKGTKFQNIIISNGPPTPSGTTDATFALDYVEVPILVKATSQDPDFRPFLFAGPTFGFKTRARADAPGTNVLARPNTSTLDLDKDVRSLDIGLDLGGGIEFRISHSSALLVDLRYSHGFSDVYDNPSVPSAKSYGFSIMAGVLFDIVRREPQAAEIIPSSAPASVALDTDGDGLLDTAEINTYKTNPYQADSDGDGLKDGEEVLTYKTNPLKADTDEDGLSDGDEVKKYKTNPLDPDTDHGGIKDGPEVFRGTNPLDPSDDMPRKEEFKIEVGKAIVLEGVVFKTGSAEIGPSSAAILEKAFNTLQQNPDILVEIHGHTDNVGKRAYNMKLSLARANAVKDYLVQRGIDASRIATQGFGFDKPVASNDTPEGKQKNRRIEFFRVR